MIIIRREGEKHKLTMITTTTAMVMTQREDDDGDLMMTKKWNTAENLCLQIYIYRFIASFVRRVEYLCCLGGAYNTVLRNCLSTHYDIRRPIIAGVSFCRTRELL